MRRAQAIEALLLVALARRSLRLQQQRHALAPPDGGVLGAAGAPVVPERGASGGWSN